MLKYWLRDENSNIGNHIFGNVFEVDIDTADQAQFERAYPDAEMVGDGLPLDEQAQSELRMSYSGGMTAYGPTFPFGAE